MKKISLNIDHIEEKGLSSEPVKSKKQNHKLGSLIVFEGPEGSGKSTQLNKLVIYFKSKKIKTILLREPGGTEISEKIRSIILDRVHTNMSEKTELLLYIACRAQIIEEKIIKLLQEGYTILQDRFYLATIVYQGYARGIDRKWIDELNKFVLNGLKENLTIIYDVTLAEAQKRMKKRVKKDRLDEEAAEFHTKVRNGYLKEAKKLKNCIVISTDNKDEESVFKETIYNLQKKGFI